MDLIICNDQLNLIDWRGLSVKMMSSNFYTGLGVVRVIVLYQEQK